MITYFNILAFVIFLCQISLSKHFPSSISHNIGRNARIAQLRKTLLCGLKRTRKKRHRLWSVHTSRQHQGLYLYLHQILTLHVYEH